MGLETVHPQALPRLNKGMTLATSTAPPRPAPSGIGLRAFVLVRPPFVPPAEAVNGPSAPPSTPSSGARSGSR